MPELIKGRCWVAPMENPEDYCYDIDCAEVAGWRRGSVVGSWLLDLTATVLRSDRELSKLDGGIKVRGSLDCSQRRGSRCSVLLLLLLSFKI